jgi:hypothetical protein
MRCRCVFLLFALPALLALADATPCLAQDTAAEREMQERCARKMRKLFEAIQAYRRLHGGTYPENTVALAKLGLVPEEALVCPSLQESRPLTAGATGTWRSTGERADPERAYQYELAPKAVDANNLPSGRKSTWREIKTALIGRPGWEQVPILRCERHSPDGGRLNLSFSGRVYASGGNWEELFVDTVPMTYRSPYMVLTRNAPPFVPDRERRAERPGTICLAAVCNSLPGDPWWWGTLDGPEHEKPATLQPLLDECRDGVLHTTEGDFDIRYLVQVQGASVPPEHFREGYVSRCFPKTIRIPIGRRLDGVTVLSGTVWRGRLGEAVGKLIWHRADGTSDETALVYGKQTGRFQGSDGSSGAKPLWQRDHEGQTLQLFATEWRNERPESPLVTVEFCANPQSPAAPFVAALSVHP